MKKSSSVWLNRESSCPKSGYVNVYRVMGDVELLYLIENDKLPNTQPYQAIVKGEDGRKYMEKYLSGQKHVSTSPTTVVEFTIQEEIWNQLFSIQNKIEDGVMSVGLGDKAGKGLILFNKFLDKNNYRIVKVKRH